jgi:hypothetical protein
VITRFFSLSGLLLVLSLLGHDSLMATVAHAAPLTSPAVTAHEHGSPHQSATLVATSPDDQHLPAHPSECSSTGAAVPSPGAQLDIVDLPIREGVADRHLAATAHPSLHRWLEPFWPPGVRRAFLRVYRI